MTHGQNGYSRRMPGVLVVFRVVHSLNVPKDVEVIHLLHPRGARGVVCCSVCTVQRETWPVSENV